MKRTTDDDTAAQRKVRRARPEKKARDLGAQPRRRLPANERELLIVEGAVRYFAEVGFEGQTRELAQRLGVTNALLFKYFPTKEALVERVYQQVYLGRWKPEWETWLKDRSVSLEARLRRFYKSYASMIFDYEWLRIFFFAGLKGVNINERYLQVLATKVVAPICEEVRHAFDLPLADACAITDSERDAVWGLQGQILYISVRRFIYRQPIGDPELIVDAAIDVFLSGISRLAEHASREGTDSAEFNKTR